MELYRIHGVGYVALDTTGSALYEGRWHLRGDRVVYAAEHVSLAALEVLVHAGGRKLPPKELTRIRIAGKFSVEQAAGMDFASSQQFGSRWLSERRTLALRVPSVLVNGLEHNFLLNPEHAEFAGVRAEAAERFEFDRSFSGR